MKIVIVMIVAMFAASEVMQGQMVSPEKVPLQVHHAFEKRFPKADNETWGTGEKGEYLVNFVMENEKFIARFTSQGQWRETKKEMSVSLLPKLITKAVDSQFEGFKIIAAYRVAIYTRKEKFYGLELAKDEETYELQVSEDGTVWKKTKE